MKLQNIILAIICGLLLSGSGVWAADFAVGAPTGNPVTDTATINTAIANALANAGPNRVIFQSSSIYVLSGTLSISGAVKNVTFTTDGANRATIVGANTTGTAYPNNWANGVFSASMTNSKVGWDNLNILPAPFSALGANSQSTQCGIGISGAASSSSSDFTVYNVLIGCNNNSNQPVSLLGNVDPTTVANYTKFGGAGFIISTISSPPRHLNVYMKNTVVSGHDNANIRLEGAAYVADACPPSTCDKVVLENCVASYSINYTGVRINNCGNLKLVNCEFHHSGHPTASSNSINVETLEIKNLLARGLYIHDSPQYGLLMRNSLQELIENCFTTANGRYGIGDRSTPRTASIENATTVIRDCTSYYDHVNDLGSTDGSFTDGFHLAAGYNLVERCTAIGSATTATSFGGMYGIVVRAPEKATIRDCYVRNWNRAGIIIIDGRTATADRNKLGADVLIERCVIEDCGTHVNANTGISHPLQSDANYDAAGAFHIFSPIALDQGGRFVVRNCTINRTKAPAISVSFVAQSPSFYATGEATIQNINFLNCAERLFRVMTESVGQNKITIENCVTNGVPAIQLPAFSLGIDVMGNNVTVRDCTVANYSGNAVTDSAAGVGSASATHTFQRLSLDTIGGDALVVGSNYQGRVNISNSVIRNTTNGSGISVRGGTQVAISSVEVTSAARYGVTIGDDGFTPQTAMNVAALDDLCLFSNGLGGLRFKEGDNSKPPMTLTNSTILGSPADLIYDHLFGQVLHVTDCILAGKNPGGVGISIPSLVVNQFSGSPAPRIKVWTSALVREGPWALTTATQVDPSNPGGTITQTQVIPGNPFFRSTTPGDSNFLWVSALGFAGKATNVGVGQSTDLDGSAVYDPDPLGIAAWRQF